jgi:hypothetical protein
MAGRRSAASVSGLLQTPSGVGAPYSPEYSLNASCDAGIAKATIHFILTGFKIAI